MFTTYTTRWSRSLTRARAPVVWGVHDYLCFSGSLHFRSGQACGRAHGPGCVP